MSSKSTENTVFVRFIPPKSEITRFHVEEIFSDIGPIKKCSIIRSPQNVGLGYGFCKFVSNQDAETAARDYQDKVVEIEGQTFTLTVELASHNKQRENEKKITRNKDSTVTNNNNDNNRDEENVLLLLQTKKKTSRVMVRNLSFHATEKDVRNTLEQQFGPVLEISLPRVDEKLHRGFCFVTFSRVRDAQRAVQPRSTPLVIKKRPVAIDYAVSKHVHQLQQEKEKGKKQDKDESDDNDDDDSSSDEEEEQVDANVEEEEEEEEENEQSDHDEDDNHNDDSRTDSSTERDDNESMESNSNPTTGNDTKQPPAEQHDDAVEQHKCLFVRNLPFDATRHDLFQLFQKFGHIESIYLVKDKNTNVQKGTAFVTFHSTKSAQQALEAAGNSGFVTTQRQDLSDTNGLHLRKRRLFVNVAVDKKTAASLTVEKQGNKVTGKDRRNLYLKMEGRVANEADGNSSSNAWEHLPESDQLKRQRAFAEKNTKLRSPLFFINSNRLSVRNLAKHVDEADFKKLCVDATKRGLETHLVTQEDQVAHWRASGEMTTRDIMKRIEQAKEESGSVIPAFDEKNVKRFIPSVYIDRDFTTNKKEKAPSRGFGFVDFEHHVHALACLRELNNNPYYAAEFVSGGKKAVDAKRLARKRKGKGEAVKGDFVSDDGRILTPRLIVDFTVSASDIKSNIILLGFLLRYGLNIY
jgi:nucleolar protein 4